MWIQGFPTGWTTLSEGIAQLGNGKRDDMVGLNPNSPEWLECDGSDRACVQETKKVMTMRLPSTPSSRTSMGRE